MGDNSAIEWTDATWNPVRGCTKVSPGCKHCYAETFAERFRGVAGHPYEQGFDLRLVPEKLVDPIRWRRPRRIFVNSMSDLFHVGIPDDYVDRVFGVMWASLYIGPEPVRGHTFQVLTKRADRMRQYLTWRGTHEQHKRWAQQAAQLGGGEDPDGIFDQTFYGAERGPHPRIWLGVSVENNTYQPRIEQLRETPAAVRFLSLEPLLGPVDNLNLDGIHWVIAGGESGPGARPMNPDWVRDIRDQCQRAGVAFFFKQWGGRLKKTTGRELDGRTWDEMPAAAGAGGAS
jgi:protein gp37